MYIGNKKVLAICITLALSAEGAHAAQSAACDAISTSTGNSNFSMLNPGGGATGGTNDVDFTWDGTLFNASSDYAGPGSTTSNATISSNEAFQSNLWTAHDVQVFGPGSYTFDSTLGGGNLESGTLSMTVGSNQFGMHMLFDWGGNNNIDVVIVLDKSATFGSGTGTFQHATTCSAAGSNCLWNSGPASSFTGSSTSNRPAGNQVWMLASVDGNGDGLPGIDMAPLGPFAGFNANFNFRGTLSPANGTCAPSVDSTADSFSFTAHQNAALSTQYTSNLITVSGLGSGVTVPVTITGGEYSKNGAPSYTALAGTATNGDTFTVQGTSGSGNNMTTTVTLSIGGVSSAFTINTPIVVAASGSNFTMLDRNGVISGGTNDVVANWDGSSCVTSAASTNFGQMTLSSVTPFFQYNWTAHHIRVFCPGTYTIDTTCTTAQLEAGVTACNNPLQTNPAQTERYYTFTVGAGQYGAHMLFDWNTATNIDVIQVWNKDAVFSPSPMYTGSGACNNSATVWNLMSTDWDHDGKNGAPMIDGSFLGFSANFNIRTSGTPLSCDALTPTVNIADPSGAGGCSISSKPSNGIERGDWWLIAGFLAWLGGIQMRFKRKIRS